MKATIFVMALLLIGLLTVPTASATGAPPLIAVNCNPYGSDGALVEVSKCVAREGGKNTDKVCRLLFGDSCRSD